MQRRSLLGALGATLAAGQAGCANRLSRARQARLPDRPEGGFAINVENYCNPADAPLLALLSDDPGDAAPCGDGARPSLAIENGRSRPIDLQITIDQPDGLVNHYALSPGERIVETRALASAGEVAGSVVVDGSEEALLWPEHSCRRHAIALSPGAVEIGWIPPLEGAADAEHACYPGDPAPLRVQAAETGRTVEVAITDRCAEATTTGTFALQADAVETREDIVRHGGDYDLEIAPEDRPAETFTFAEICGGLSVRIAGDGSIEAGTLPMA